MSRLYLSVSAGHEVQAADGVAGESILSEDAIGFVNRLVRRFSADVGNLLADRDTRQDQVNKGDLPGFPPETRGIREGDWQVAPIPKDLLDRRVEITGPPDRRTVVEALNSGARVFIADFEDSLSPTWANVIEGQWSLYEAVRRTLSIPGSGGMECPLSERTAALIVRPRGWHLAEYHWTVDGRSVPAALVDFGLYLFHNHAVLLKRGTPPCFCLPKLESRGEARLWAEVIAYAEAALHLPPGTIRVTAMIETLPAAFEMDEILWELKDSIVGLSCGHSDYLFSIIKTLHEQPAFVLPERELLTMTTPFMHAYSQLLIKTCHRRGAFALGGVAAQILSEDPAASEAALAKMRADTERQAASGYDGTRVSHPGLVPVALEVFDRWMPTANNLARTLPDVTVTEADLLRFPAGAISEPGLRACINVSLQYLRAWLSGNGCVPIHNMMDDTATAEICRAQVSQWMRHQKRLGDGRPVTFELVRGLIREEHRALARQPAGASNDPDYLAKAVGVLTELLGTLPFPEFLTLRAYDELTLLEKERGVL